MIENTLLVTIDSLRADYVPGHSNSNTDTSVFSLLSNEGVSFENVFATGPGTTCSFPALLTGTLPLSYDGLGPLSTDRPKLASKLRDSGRATAGFQTNPFLSEYFNYDIGFETFEDYQNPLIGLATELFPRGIEINNPNLRKLNETFNITGLLKRTYQTFSGKSRPYVTAEVITDDIIEWLNTTTDSFFCWGHYMDVHHPCFPPADIRRQFGLESVTATQVSDWYSQALEEPDELTNHERDQFKRLYEAAIVYVDTQIGRIVDHLKQSGRWEDTLVVVTSDHGELFGEYGAYGKPVRMYDELLRVPLIVVNGPDAITNHRSDLLSLLDIPPLIHEALGLDIPTEYDGQVPGTDARSHVIAEHQIEDEVVIGARTDTHLYEFNSPRGEAGEYRVGPNTFTQTTEQDATNTTLHDIVEDRIRKIDVTVDMLELDEDVENRLADLGYL
jgi:arylsulfatase A-like enzyme